jgi:hypothetical protein
MAKVDSILLLILLSIVISPIWAQAPARDLSLERQTLGKVYYQRAKNIYVAEIHKYFKPRSQTVTESFQTHSFEALHRHDQIKESIPRRPRDMRELKTHPYAQLLWPQGADGPELRIGPKTWSVPFLEPYGPGKGEVFRGEDGELVLVWLSQDPEISRIQGPQWFFVNTTKGADFFYLNEMGFTAYQAGDLNQAESLFHLSHQINPHFRFSGFNLICTRALLGEPWQESQGVIQTVLFPGNGQAQFYEKISTDADLESWRKEPAFLSFLASTLTDQ